MIRQKFRLPVGGLIDRLQPIEFRFDGKRFEGYEGDTLASALLANAVRLVGRSFKYHRPRGIFTSGSEEPNALVELREGARREPNTRATVTELFEGLSACSQNRWPSLRFDWRAVNGLISALYPRGFTTKRLCGPRLFGKKFTSHRFDGRRDWVARLLVRILITTKPAGITAIYWLLVQVLPV